MIASFENIVDALVDTGVYIGASIFGDELTARLYRRAHALHVSGALADARVGRASQSSRIEDIRRDRTLWLDEHPTDSSEREATLRVNELREALNASLFLGAKRAELHFAHYEAGAFYRVHRDRFADDDARTISLVFYLNEAWPLDAGGELAMYDEALTLLYRVPPRAGTMVAFRSERFPHEVLAATRDRFSLTGWLRRD
ncbi:MAG: 2OG-Fe(II) oxygenase [Casimicrobium sp.]